MTPDSYRPRLVDRRIEEWLGAFPAIMLVGPRAVGKTTTALQHAASVVRLDQPGVATAFRADPDAALRGLAEPVLVDEWQVAPDVLGARVRIHGPLDRPKRTVDTDPRPGRLIVTGSTRADNDHDTWPGTGRLVRLTMHGMTIREQLGRLDGMTFLDRVASGQPIPNPTGVVDLRDLVELALRGGFPESLTLADGVQRHAWLASYVTQLATRDMRALDPGRDPRRLRAYVDACALNTAGVVDHRTLYDAASIDRRTAIAYDRLLEDLLFVDMAQAWRSNRLKRLVATPKRYLVEPALLTGALGLDAEAVLRDGDLLGRLLDTFVTAQLRAELQVAQTPGARIHHLRQQDGRREVDIVVELPGRGIVAIEVKAAAPSVSDARHLAWLAQELGDDFIAGVVLHAGTHGYPLGERITALPMTALWA